MSLDPPLPILTDENRHFWTGGAEGELRFLRCLSCGHYLHPPAPRCTSCRSDDLAVEAVSGRATVATYTVNHQRWSPELEVPYVIAIVELPEQRGLRLTTNIIHCPVEQVRIGMPVRVVFEKHADVHLPLFEPETP